MPRRVPRSPDEQSDIRDHSNDPDFASLIRATLASHRHERNRGSQSAAIPDWPDRCPRPARSEATAIIAAAVEAGPAEIVPVAIIPIIARHRVDIPWAPLTSRPTPRRIFLGVEWKVVVQRLMVTRQEAVAMPVRSRPLMNRRSRRCDGQQRKYDSNRQTHKARHLHTIEIRLSGRHSNPGQPACCSRPSRSED
jgi:hypothetical protein